MAPTECSRAARVALCLEAQMWGRLFAMQESVHFGRMRLASSPSNRHTSDGLEPRLPWQRGRGFVWFGPGS